MRTGSHCVRRGLSQARSRQHRTNYSHLPQEVAMPEPEEIPPLTKFFKDHEHLTKEEYHYPDSSLPRNHEFDRRLAVYRRAYEPQEMDGRVRWALQKELDAAERQIGQLVIRMAEPLRGQKRVEYEQRIESAKKLLTRYYRQVDSDLRSGEESRVARAEHQLKLASVMNDDDRFDWGAAAHRRYGAELQGSPGAEERLKAQEEVDGQPHADAEILNMHESMGFLEEDEFGMLRREVGEEATNALATSLRKNRDDIVRRRLKHMSDYIRLSQLERRMAVAESAAVHSPDSTAERRAMVMDSALKNARQAQPYIDAFEASHSLDGAADLNQKAHEMRQEERRQRAKIIAERRAKRPAEQREKAKVYWEDSAGMVHNPKHFVDADWFELASDDPSARNAFAKRLRRDVRTLQGDADVLAQRESAAESVLSDADAFNAFRKEHFDRGYSRSQVLKQDDSSGVDPSRYHNIARNVRYNRLNKDTGRHYHYPGELTRRRWAEERSARQREDTERPGIGRAEYDLPHG
eukprot:TRINITY_DN20000_c0_g1_i1.p1 TRINITY_DN20000_c0_g1~~TRINITY_DN20000_c0_g1_i1.p1  ORF type:complete len:521 (+),score=162.99 TRINITY_DN20000_c0_g1_i1:64-1626(+)